MYIGRKELAFFKRNKKKEGNKSATFKNQAKGKEDNCKIKEKIDKFLGLLIIEGSQKNKVKNPNKLKSSPLEETKDFPKGKSYNQNEN